MIALLLNTEETHRARRTGCRIPWPLLRYDVFDQGDGTQVACDSATFAYIWAMLMAQGLEKHLAQKIQEWKQPSRLQGVSPL